jgi:hypothetical protein
LSSLPREERPMGMGIGRRIRMWMAMAILMAMGTIMAIVRKGSSPFLNYP